MRIKQLKKTFPLSDVGTFLSKDASRISKRIIEVLAIKSPWMDLVEFKVDRAELWRTWKLVKKTTVLNATIQLLKRKDHLTCLWRQEEAFKLCQKMHDHQTYKEFLKSHEHVHHSPIRDCLNRNLKQR